MQLTALLANFGSKTMSFGILELAYINIFSLKMCEHTILSVINYSNNFFESTEYLKKELSKYLNTSKFLYLIPVTIPLIKM